MNRSHKYRITVTALVDEVPVAKAPAPLVFTHENHDDLAVIVDRVRRSSGLDADTAAATAIGLKLLGEIVLKHRDNVLFDPLRTPLREFIRSLKSMAPQSEPPDDMAISSSTTSSVTRRPTEPSPTAGSSGSD